MIHGKLSDGTAHTTPDDVGKILTSKPTLCEMWEDITPLARNEWLCWILSAKKSETRDRRMKIMSENLMVGKRRPCCWAGCVHR